MQGMHLNNQLKTHSMNENTQVTILHKYGFITQIFNNAQHPSLIQNGQEGGDGDGGWEGGYLELML